jgi:hypothetical protein
LILIAHSIPASFFRTSNPGGLIVWCAVGICAGIYLFVRGFGLLQRRRLILDTPFSKIRSAAMGMVEVSGLATGPYTVVAPISARPCYYYRTLVWEYRREGKNTQWVKVAGECAHVPFFVDDNTGRLLVDPHGADLDLHHDFEQEFCDSFFSTKDAAPDNVHSFLARHGVFTGNKIKVEECCIKPKNSLFILGTLAENHGLQVRPEPVQDVESMDRISSPGLSFTFGSLFSGFGGGGDENFAAGSFATRFAGASNGPAPQIIRLSPEAHPSEHAAVTQQQKVAAALRKAGISNPAAWSAAGMGNAQAAVMTDPSATESGSAQSNGFDLAPPVVLTKGTNNKTFLISWRSQQEVARALGWKCTLMIWGGPAVALVSLYVLLSLENLL